VVGRGDAEAVGVQVHVARGVRQRELEEFIDLVRLPEPEETAGIATRSRDQEPVGVKSQAPDQTQDVLLGPEQPGFLAGPPVENDDRRVADGAERVAGLNQPAAGEVLSVEAERQVAHSAIILRRVGPPKTVWTRAPTSERVQ